MSIILFALYGGCLYRWRGHASKYKKYFPRPFNQILFAAPYAYYTYVTYPDIWWLALIIWVLATLATLTGHGNALDMGTAPRGKDETLEFAVKWLHKKIPEYWYDVILMAWLGLAKTLPCGIVCLNPFIAVSGILKAVAYMIGWQVSPSNYATSIGEFLTGLFLYGVLGTAIINSSF